MIKKTSLISMSLFLISSCGTVTDEVTKSEVDLTSGNYDCVILKTNMGDITLALDNVNAPNSTSNFLGYSNSLFYEGTIFHRVIDDFVIQGGGFTSTLEKKETLSPIANEAHNGLLNVRGSIAAARTSAPHSATSQFYINTVDNVFLDHVDDTNDGWGYAVFGEVVKGMDVVDAISKVPTSANFPFDKDVPIENVIIQTTLTIPCDSI